MSTRLYDTPTRCFHNLCMALSLAFQPSCTYFGHFLASLIPCATIFSVQPPHQTSVLYKVFRLSLFWYCFSFACCAALGLTGLVLHLFLCLHVDFSLSFLHCVTTMQCLFSFCVLLPRICCLLAFKSQLCSFVLWTLVYVRPFQACRHQARDNVLIGLI